jgi:rhamnosyltransferase
MLDVSNGEGSRELYEYLRSSTTFPIKLLWDNILRTCNLDDVVNALSLFYVLPDSTLLPEVADLPIPRTALHAHLFFMDLLDESVALLANMPTEVDLFVTTPAAQVDTVTAALAKLPNKVMVLPTENRGRGIAPFLVTVAPYLRDYDLACHYHDKKSTQAGIGIVGRSFAFRMEANMVGTPELVRNIQATFAANPQLGLLAPSGPHHGPYYWGLTSSWSVNYGNTVKLSKRLGLHVPMERAKSPVSPDGCVFWFRPEGMAKLFDAGFTYQDFPVEDGTVPDDGGLVHAIERVFPFVAQDARFYSAYGFSTSFASFELANLRWYLRTTNTALSRVEVIGTNERIGTHDGMIHTIQRLRARRVRAIGYRIAKKVSRYVGARNYRVLAKVAKRVLGIHGVEGES